MKPPSSRDDETNAMVTSLLCDEDTELDSELDQFLLDISKLKYGAKDVWDIAQQQKRLSPNQRQQLADPLHKH